MLFLGYDNLAEAGKKKKDRQKMPFEVGHGLRYSDKAFLKRYFNALKSY